MKTWRCPECARETNTEDDCKLCLCKGCLAKMEEKESGRKI